MARDLTAGMVTEVTAAALEPIIFIKAEFDSGDLNLFTGLGSISFGGDTYTGGGDLLTFSAIEETEVVEANNVTIGLTGIKSSVISIALGEDYQDRQITVWFGALDSSGALIADPQKIFSGRMDVMQIEDGGETASISVRCESNLITLKRPKERRYTSEDQKSDHPTDTFFDQVESLQDAQVTWGRT